MDAIKFIKEIPDTTTSQSCKCIMTVIQNLDKKDRDELLMLAKKYPPMVRALLGAMVESIYGTKQSIAIMEYTKPSYLLQCKDR